jgi:hypothetical protein
VEHDGANIHRGLIIERQSLLTAFVGPMFLARSGPCSAGLDRRCPARAVRRD